MDQSRCKQDAVLENVQHQIMRSKKNIVSNDTAPIPNKYKDSLSDIEDSLEDNSSPKSPKRDLYLSSSLSTIHKANSPYTSTTTSSSLPYSNKDQLEEVH